MQSIMLWTKSQSEFGFVARHELNVDPTRSCASVHCGSVTVFSQMEEATRKS
jgi:hypothetical protein